MNKAAQQKKHTRITYGKMVSVTIRGRKNGSFKALLSSADDVVERHVTKSLSSSVLSQKDLTHRPMRAPHLSGLERDLEELKKVVAALAVRSVAHEEKAADFDVEGITVLDANTAYQLLDNPPEPTDTLRNLLALR
ncbi:hypothetical protein C4J89_1200 [Pseudomonas sp. R4-35-07]|uniref:hypothetical protein n=1 Tax=unclassified Pseudomonas TaxID=196821 RepID=UPI000F56A65E|nr:MULTISPECIES: hypothetical protein [unclassified Pseudomonas]AZF20037.1 hypothetical protein C4J91_1271 [Pseudomonas sp. R3-52-08]AZF30691.1 hypothetical protein C4J89_1200 [Pseudomonas sp. R4-35-07]